GLSIVRRPTYGRGRLDWSILPRSRRFVGNCHTLTRVAGSWCKQWCKRAWSIPASGARPGRLNVVRSRALERERRQRIESALDVEELRIGVEVHGEVDRRVPERRLRRARRDSRLREVSPKRVTKRLLTLLTIRSTQKSTIDTTHLVVPR